jgi:predicted lipoprotein with Yx(FWY)xxD motif
MRKTSLTLAIAMVALGIAGCSRDADTEVAATAPPVSATTPPPADTQPTAVALTLAESPAGTYVADSTGRAVYILEGDATGTKCTGDCLAAWPPVLAASATPGPGAGGLQGQIGTVQRDDGTLQLTLNGQPLYHHAKDAGPGTTTGQAVKDTWGEWYLVAPNGLAIETGPSTAGVTAEAPADEPTPSGRELPADAPKPAPEPEQPTEPTDSDY